MFAAAPSQDDTLRALCADCTVDWSRVNAFHMDEYIGLAETHPAGFRTYLKTEFSTDLPSNLLILLMETRRILTAKPNDTRICSPRTRLTSCCWASEKTDISPSTIHPSLILVTKQLSSA